MNFPVCCGIAMRISDIAGRFMEMKCIRCGDVVYIKRYVTDLIDFR